MRTLTTAQQAALSSRDYSVHVRVRVADRTGTLQDLSTLEEINWVDRVTWSDVVDAPVSEATVYLRRDAEDLVLSLAPFRTDSPLNEVDEEDFWSLLDMGRRMVIEVAVLALDDAPASGDWVLVWDGEIDAVSWGQTPIQVRARDGSATAQDRWIETPTEYGLDGGRAVELVMQDILDAWAPTYTLVVPEAPGFLITTYEQGQQPVLEALRVLAGLIGWNVKWRWNQDAGGFRLTFYEPDREPDNTAWTFGPSHYLDVTRLEVDRIPVRNVVDVSYRNAATGQRETVRVESSGSIARYGRRWMELEEGDASPIDSPAEATALATAALSDLSEPLADQEIETLFFWPVEIEDFLEFLPNGVHYNGPRELACVAVRHDLSVNNHRTYITTRGRPVGLYQGWFDRPPPAEPSRPVEPPIFNPLEADPPLIIVDRPYRCSTGHRGYVVSRDRLATNPLNPELTDPAAWIEALVTRDLPGDLLPWQPFPGLSQKNLAAVGYNSITDTLLVGGGNAGTISEVPPTAPYFIRSRTGGTTWEGFFPAGWGSGLDFFGDPYTILPFAQSNGRLICGDGTWMVVDMRGGWSRSFDDGQTWTPFQYLPVGPSEDPSFQPLSLAYGENGQWAVAGAIFNQDTFDYDVYLFRSVGAHAASGWFGNATEAGTEPQTIAYGNGLWIVGMSGPGFTGRIWRCLDPDFVEAGFEDAGRVVVSTGFQSDVYEGTVGLYPTSLVVNEIRYLPRAGGGGRWWIYGSINALVYSDDDGVTWSNALCNHASGSGGDTIHPILDWRRSNAAGYNGSSAAHPRITYITQSPDNLDLLIAVGCTYEREEDGITDPLRVFATSTDGGTTWGPVRQVPSPDPIQTAPEPGGWALIRPVPTTGAGGGS